jgi:transcription termination factor Rho
MGAAELSELHLAELHRRAADAGIEGYRLLRREELIERLGGAEEPVERPEADDEPSERREGRDEPSERPRRRRGRRGGRRRGGRERERLPADDVRDEGEREGRRQRQGDDGEPEATEDVTGILEITRQRHGFLRLGGLTARDDDVYVSASQVRRCELRPGDEVSGPAREPRRGERHRALVHVDRVNGGDPQEEGRVEFDDLTPVPPSRPIPLGAEAGPQARAADQLAPLAFGQRVLVRAAPRSDRATLLRELGQAITAGGAANLIVLLIDERPEEVPAWERALPEADLALAPADLAPAEQVRLAELALERSRRIAESGADAVLVCDSLTRLAVAADDVGEVKRLFGSGRELDEEGSGSLTVIATAFDEGDDEGSAARAVATTENSLLVLDDVLAEAERLG